jgi:hypothetical protein
MFAKGQALIDESEGLLIGAWAWLASNTTNV